MSFLFPLSQFNTFNDVRGFMVSSPLAAKRAGSTNSLDLSRVHRATYDRHVYLVNKHHELTDHSGAL